MQHNRTTLYCITHIKCTLLYGNFCLSENIYEHINNKKFHVLNYEYNVLPGMYVCIYIFICTKCSKAYHIMLQQCKHVEKNAYHRMWQLTVMFSFIKMNTNPRIT